MLAVDLNKMDNLPGFTLRAQSCGMAFSWFLLNWANLHLGLFKY
jgi:hypothetical protein